MDSRFRGNDGSSGQMRPMYTRVSADTITLRHTALGLFPDGYREALSQGWPHLFARIRRRVEKA